MGQNETSATTTGAWIPYRYFDVRNPGAIRTHEPQVVLKKAQFDLFLPIGTFRFQGNLELLHFGKGVFRNLSASFRFFPGSDKFAGSLLDQLLKMFRPVRP
jgi:hypothetical protein